MDYLFNIQLEEASELHDVLGFVDADFSMKQILPYLRSATKDIIDIIGKTLYQKAVGLYTDDNNNEFAELLRYAIGLNAFRQYAPLSDVSYTTSGRLFRTDENTKSAFEWMIDKSDDAMERSYYASVNEIIRYIFDELPSDAVSITKKFKLDELFVYSLSVFQEYVNINDFYLLYFKLIPSLKQAEKRLVLSRVRDKYDFYKDNEDHPVNSVIKNVCVYFAMKDGLKKESVQLFPKGVIKEISGSKKHTSASLMDIESAVLYYDDELKVLLKELENAVAKDTAKSISGPVINFGSDDQFVTL